MTESAADAMTAEQAAEFDALDARAAAAEPPAEAAAQVAGSSGESPAPVVEWGYVAAGLVGMFAVYADGWQLTRDEQGALASHLAATLQAWFPDAALDSRWQAVAALAMVAGGVAMSRVDPESRRLRPLRAPRPEPPADAAK